MSKRLVQSLLLSVLGLGMVVAALACVPPATADTNAYTYVLCNGTFQPVSASCPLNTTGGGGATPIPTIPPATQTAAPQALGTAAPVNALGQGFNSAGTLQPFIACDKSATINSSTSGFAELVAAVSGKKVYVCSMIFQASGTVVVKFAQGTKVSTACDTGEADLTGPMQQSTSTGMAVSGGTVPVLTAAASDELCVSLGANVQVSGWITYAQFAGP